MELKSSRKKVFTRKAISLYLLFLPMGLLLFIFQYIPLCGNIMAFVEYSPYKGIFESTWVGLKYFSAFIKDAKFWEVINNTLLINFYEIIFSFPAPIIFAILVNEVCNTYFKKIIQTVSYLPHFLSWVVVSGMVYQILSPGENGIVNVMLGKLFGIEPYFFMSDASAFRPIAVISEMWKSTGWGAILYFATITGIDSGLYDSAYIDGANRIKQIIYITLPGLQSIIILMFLLKLSNLFTIGFERIFLLQNPLNYETSDVISTYIYRLGLERAQFSLTTAIGLVQSTLGFTLLVLSNKMSKKLSGMGLY